ncbi:O-antigen ligase family protein [Flavobacterium suzhouense]|uniref:O-antigen ligase family protein n=1 Tax=Flavobacterium suzhouense TaxID=1529638 RepID=A0ABW5NVK1_9FLAO
MISLNKIKTYEYITALVAAFPLLGQKGSVYVIIIWSIYSLFIAIKLKSFRPDRKDIIDILILSSLYLAYTISYFFATDKHEVGKLLERALPFLLFPIFMIINKYLINEKTRMLTMRVFSFSCIVLCLYVWTVIFSQGIEKVFKSDDYYNPVIRNIFSDTTGMHLPYLGMLFVFAALLFLYDLLSVKGKSFIFYIIRLLSIVFLLFSVAAFMARMALFIFVIVGIFFCLKKIRSAKQLIGIGIIGIIIVGSVLMLPSSQRRINESLSAKYELPHAGQSSEEVNFRYGVYHCVKEILSEYWLTGVGVDNVQKKLDECYSSYTYRNSDDYMHTTYNSHNQYFDIMLKYGIVGLILFVISLLWGVKTKDTVYQGFLIVIFIALLSENVFSRQAGIVFFTFFNTLFFVTTRRHKKGLE